MVSINNSIGNTIGGSNSGVTNTFTVTNSSNTASSQANEVITVGGGTAGDPYTTYTVSGATNFSIGIDNSASDAFVIAASTALGTTNVMSVATTGEINFPLTSAFLAQSAGQTDVTGDGTDAAITFATEIFDQNSDFASSTFTAPVAGRYYLATLIGYNQVNTASRFQGQISTSNRNYTSECSVTVAGNSYSVGIATFGDMDAADTASIVGTVQGITKTVDIRSDNYTWFCGNLEC